MNRMIRCRWAGLVGLALLIVALPMTATGQEGNDPGQTPPPEVADSVQLVFEREVFSYPSFQRRNPFAPLTGDDSGPRFEQLRLMAVLLSPAPGQSIALVGSGSGEGMRTYRVRAGDVIGNMRVLAITARAVRMEVDEFGIREVRTLELARPDQAPPPAADPQTDEDVASPPDTAGDTIADPDSVGTAGATGADPDSSGTADMNGTGGLA